MRMNTFYKYWWSFVVRGICLLSLGIIVLRLIASEKTAAGYLFTIYLLIEGAFALIHSLAGERNRGDWMFIITADDMRNVKRFSHLLIKEYQIWISEVHIVEDIFSVKKCGIVNPNVDKLKEIV